MKIPQVLVSMLNLKWASLSRKALSIVAWQLELHFLNAFLPTKPNFDFEVFTLFDRNCLRCPKNRQTTFQEANDIILFDNKRCLISVTQTANNIIQIQHITYYQ